MSEITVVRRKVRYDMENSLVGNRGCVKCLFLVCLHCRGYYLPAAIFSAFSAQLMKRKRNSFGIRHWDVLLLLVDSDSVEFISTLSSIYSYHLVLQSLIPEFVTKLQSYSLYQTHAVIPLKATQPFLLSAMKLMMTFMSMNTFHGAHSKKKWTTIFIKELAF